MKLAELTWPDLEQVSRDLVVVYPIAALEQHGPHLPFITDTAEVAAIIDRLDAEIPDEILCLPVQWLGYSPHHMRFKGTITARSETTRFAIPSGNGNFSNDLTVIALTRAP